VQGPLSSANGPLPWLIFTRPEWRQQIEEYFVFPEEPFQPFTALAYFATGGISHRIFIPGVVYRPLFALDLALSRSFPRLVAAFFTIVLSRK
jgi:hypothetical protein